VGCDNSKDYKISICLFSAKHEALRSQSKTWLTRKLDNEYVWSAMPTCEL